MLNCVEVIYETLINGVTKPKRALLDNQMQVCLKTLGNPEGSIALFNDYFGSSLAAKLSLNVPKFGFCKHPAQNGSRRKTIPSAISA